MSTTTLNTGKEIHEITFSLAQRRLDKYSLVGTDFVGPLDTGTDTNGLVSKFIANGSMPSPFVKNLHRDLRGDISVLVHANLNHFDDRAVCALILSIYSYTNKIRIGRCTIDPIKDSSINTWENKEMPYSIIADIGRVYDGDHGYFDHHQELDEAHKDFAAFGLVWEYFTDEETREYYREFDKFVHKMDLHDVGVMPNELCSFFRNYNLMPTEKTNPNEGYENAQLGRFFRTVKLLSSVFDRMLIKCHINRLCEKEIKEHSHISKVTLGYGEEKNVIIMDKYYQSWMNVAKDNGCIAGAWLNSDTDRNPGKYTVRNVQNEETYIADYRFPEAWAEAPLEHMTFCHKAGFLCVVDSEEDVLDVCSKMVSPSEPVEKEKNCKCIHISLVLPINTDLESIKNSFEQNLPFKEGVYVGSGWTSKSGEYYGDSTNYEFNMLNLASPYNALGHLGKWLDETGDTIAKTEPVDSIMEGPAGWNGQL